jgi:hypothetical protein
MSVVRRDLVKTAVLTVMAFALLPGCEKEDEGRGEKTIAERNVPAFSHKRHFVEEDVDCTSCHKTAETAEEASMPQVNTCMKCHEGLDEKKKPEQRVAAFLKDGKPVWSNASAAPLKTKFSHKAHAEARVQCASCHRGILKSTTVTPALRVKDRECLDCHDPLPKAKHGAAQP